MPYRIATGLMSAPVPGAWHRLKVLLDNDSVGMQRYRTAYDRLESFGVPRHHVGLLWMVKSWEDNRVPPDVALALWLLRRSMNADGSLPRFQHSTPEDVVVPTLRYVELATNAGERLDTDPELRHAVAALIRQQNDDGSILPTLGFPYGEVGGTARTLRTFTRLCRQPVDKSGEFAEEVRQARAAAGRMRDFLVQTVRRSPEGTGWSYTRVDENLIVGASSLAASALLECDPEWPPLREVLEFILAAQQPSGGWGEVPHASVAAIHNTFNAVRALRAAAALGVTPQERVAQALNAATGWFRKEIDRRPPRAIDDRAFAVRLAVELEMFADPRMVRLVRHLSQARNRFLAVDADRYAETELAALALLECASALVLRGEEGPRWASLWSLHKLAPPFLSPKAYLYELLYVPVSKRWWFVLVDRAVNAGVVDRAIGLLLGTVAALGFVNETMVNALGQGARGTAATVAIAVVLAVWLAVKASAQMSIRRAVTSSLGSFGAALLLSWLLATPGLRPLDLVAVVCLRWLVIDLIAYTADSSGLLGRLLAR